MRKICFVILIFVLIFLITSCNAAFIEDSFETKTIIEDSGKDEVRVLNDDIVRYDLGLSPIEIIIPKNQTISQSLSIVVTDNDKNLIVFDGGRVEDSDYLCEIIKEKGGRVNAWYLTHIHDDHIGALYKVLSDKRSDIRIDTIVYGFPSFEWYYEKMGDDSGIYLLFMNAITEYNNYMGDTYNMHVGFVNMVDNKDLYYEFKSDNAENNVDELSFTVRALNFRYLLDTDPINNSSIVYQVKFKNGKSMIVFGDLGYEGGEKFFSEIEDKDLSSDVYSADILVLSHHGQNGIDPRWYLRFSPKIVIWPTSEDIYVNRHGKYTTGDTKEALSKINSIEYEIFSYLDTYVIE